MMHSWGSYFVHVPKGYKYAEITSPTKNFSNLIFDSLCNRHRWLHAPVEGLSFVEALYYNIVTVSTVGYGDIHPTNQASRLFAVLLIVMGGATFLGVIANATEIIILKRDTRQGKKS